MLKLPPHGVPTCVSRLYVPARRPTFSGGRVTGENKIQLCGAFRNGENELDEDKCGLPRGLVERMPTITGKGLS